MTTISHKLLSGTQLHEPKGAGSATIGTVYVSDGAGSGAWQSQHILARGYIDGCILSNASGDTTNDIAISAGVCRDSTNTVDITVAAMTTGKRLDANWAPGDTNGMRNSAVAIANTTYHIYAIAKADGTQDIYAHTSTTVATVITALQAETGGASYVYARLIGSIVRASAAILQFVQDGDQFLATTPALDYNVTNPGASAVTATLASIPTGIIVQSLITVVATGSSTLFYMLLSSLDCADVAPSSTNGMLEILNLSPFTTMDAFDVKTNTSAQIRYRISGSGANDNIKIYSRGWIHPRGKNT